MKHCSCGSSDIEVTPNRSASGWGASSYTYTCRRCGRTMTEATIDDLRRAWDREMSKEQVRWEVLVAFDDHPIEEVTFDTVDDLLNLITMEYRTIKSMRIEKRVTRRGKE